MEEAFRARGLGLWSLAPSFCAIICDTRRVEAIPQRITCTRFEAWTYTVLFLENKVQYRLITVISDLAND